MPSKEEYFDASLPKPSKAHWIPWLKGELEQKGIKTETPEMPEPYEPKYDLWVSEFEKLNVDEDTILVGHSCGGGFLLRYFSEHPELKPKKIILVAPWIDPEPRELATGFFEFEIDKTLTDRVELVVFYSTDDDEVCIRSANIIEQTLPNATYHKFTDKGHFTEGDLGTKEFPELLEEVLN